MNYDYLKELFIDEAKPALQRHSGGSGGATVQMTSAKGNPLVPATRINKIYPNLNLTNEQITRIASRYYASVSAYGEHLCVFYNADETAVYALMILPTDDGPAIMLANYVNQNDSLIYYYPTEIPETGIEKAGWQTKQLSEDGCFIMPDLELYMEGAVFSYPEAIDILSELFSINEPFSVIAKSLNGNYDGSSIEINKNSIIDMSSLLNDNKLPLEINVNVYSTGGETTLKSLLDYCKSCERMFQNNINIVDLTPFISYDDTSSITNMDSMFVSCSCLETVPLFNTSKVTTMDNMFNNCSALKEVPLFDTSNVTNMSYFLSDCSDLKMVPLFNTSKVTKMNSMFNNCSALKEVPLFDTSNVTDMSYMFADCSNLTSVTISNTSKVNSMTGMFMDCTKLEFIILPYLSSNVSISSMVQNCTSLKALVIREFSDSIPAASSYTFKGSSIANGTGYIYVPRVNIDAVKAAAYWSNYPNQIRVLEDYTVDGTTTGDLDLSKI